MLTFFAAVFTFFVLVAFHEWGHFYVARLCGVRVLNFSIGFGYKLFSWRDKKGTVFQLSAIPLGGYVRFLEENTLKEVADEEEVQESQRFDRQKKWARALIILGGPLANFLLAIVVLWGVYLYGVQEMEPRVGFIRDGSIAMEAGLERGMLIRKVNDNAVISWDDVYFELFDNLGETSSIHLEVVSLSGVASSVQLRVTQWLKEAESSLLEDLGISYYTPIIPPMIHEVLEGSAADRAGFQSGDYIASINGVPVEHWDHFTAIIRESAGQELVIGVMRRGDLKLLKTYPDSVPFRGGVIGRVGLSPEIPDWSIEERGLRTNEYSIFQALKKALYKTGSMVELTLDSLWKIITGSLSYKYLSGPVSIVQYAGLSAEQGWQVYLNFLCIISVSLGVLNLLPIPVLDGGHLLLLSLEGIVKSSIHKRIQEYLQYVGLLLIGTVMVMVIFADIVRLTG